MISQWRDYVQSDLYQHESLVDISNMLTYCRQQFSFRLGAIAHSKEQIHAVLANASLNFEEK